MSVIMVSAEELGTLSRFVVDRVEDGVCPMAVDLAFQEVSHANGTAHAIRHGTKASAYSARLIGAARHDAASRPALHPLMALRLALKLCDNIFPGQVRTSQATCLYDIVSVVIAALPHDEDFASLRRLDARRVTLGSRAHDACTLGLFLRAFCRRAALVLP